ASRPAAAEACQEDRREPPGRSRDRRPTADRLDRRSVRRTSEVGGERLISRSLGPRAAPRRRSGVLTSAFAHEGAQAGTYVSLTVSAPIRSFPPRRSFGRIPAKNGAPRPRTTGWRNTLYSSMSPRSA